MTATLKTTIIQEPSSATPNMTLNTSGGVDLGVASTIATVPIVTTTGTQTLTNKTLTGPTINSPTLNSPTINTPTMGGSVLTSDTAKASTSGTTVQFTGIPSWAKRITVMFGGVSTSGTSVVIIQLGTSGGFVTSGYIGSGSVLTSGVASTSPTNGFATGNSTTANAIRSGSFTISNLTGNAWTMSGSTGRSDASATDVGGGYISLGGELDRIRVTTVGGSDTFDAGTINIMYE